MRVLLIIFTSVLVWLSPVYLSGQDGDQDSLDLAIAVLNFTNNTNSFAYDQLVNSIPEMLKTELSQYPQLVVVERQRIEKIMTEQALTLTGFADEASAQEVGQLLGAKYILTGELSQINSHIRIDCHIISVETGQVKGEKIGGPGGDAFEKMVQLLAGNIFHNLTGEGNFQSTVRLRKYPTRWFLVSTALTAITTGVSYIVSQNAYTSYKNAVQLDDFDRYYKRANNFRKVRNGFIAATSVLAITTAIMWFKDRDRNNRIYALVDPEKRFEPYLAIYLDQGVQFQWTIKF